MQEERAGLVAAVTPEEIATLESDVITELARRAVDQRVVSRAEDAVVRDILPKTDLWQANEVWTQTVSANAYNTIISGDLTDKKIVAFYGVKNKAAVPRTTAIRFGLGAGPAKIKDIWEIESIRTEENVAGYVRTPVIYNKSEHLHIDFYGDSSGTDEVVLLGKIVEPRGEVIVGGTAK